MQKDVEGGAGFILRHSIVPYRTLGMFCMVILAWTFVASYRSRNWGGFESAALLSGVYLLWVLMGLWYAVGMRDGSIWQRAFGQGRVSLPVKNITSVGREISDAKTLATMNRPFDRITIQGAVGAKEVIVDVSARHFVAADIRRLMRLIREARPDLTLPQNWLEPY